MTAPVRPSAAARRSARLTTLAVASVASCGLLGAMAVVQASPPAPQPARSAPVQELQPVRTDAPVCVAVIVPHEDGSWTSGDLLLDGLVVAEDWGSPENMPRWGWLPSYGGVPCEVRAEVGQ